VSEPEQEQWKPIWDAWPGFRVSWDGNFYADARKSPSGRNQKAQPIATTTTDDGYILVKYPGKDGKRVTRQAHRVVLENFAFKGAPVPDGLQSRHWDDRGTNNKWRPGATEEESRARGGNLFTGDGPKQHEDKVRNNGGKPLPVPPPAHDCINHERCGGKTRNPGKRCVPCVEQVGREAGAMLRDRENLGKVRDHFRFKSADWVYGLAVKYGGYTGSKDEAWAQHRGRLQRVTAKVRGRLRRGDAGSQPERQQAGRAGTAPFGRASPDQKLGQSRTSWTPDVAERSDREVVRGGPKVTERDHIHPYPADLVQRDTPSRTRGGTARRSR
jgi:hypothetical protein